MPLTVTSHFVSKKGKNSSLMDMVLTRFIMKEAKSAASARTGMGKAALYVTKRSP